MQSSKIHDLSLQFACIYSDEQRVDLSKTGRAAACYEAAFWWKIQHRPRFSPSVGTHSLQSAPLLRTSISDCFLHSLSREPNDAVERQRCSTSKAQPKASRPRRWLGSGCSAGV